MKLQVLRGKKIQTYEKVSSHCFVATSASTRISLKLWLVSNASPWLGASFPGLAPLHVFSFHKKKKKKKKEVENENVVRKWKFRWDETKA
jgi:hypothetical protein